MPGLLTTERACLDRYLPGLREALDRMPPLDRERPHSGVIGLFRDAGGAGLLVPQRYHGKGASALDAVRVQRALGAISPSLAIASTMHHFSVATLAEMAVGGSGMEWLLLQGVAESNLLLASGFAEGQPGQHVLRPTMTARRTEGGLLVTGAKKPCSLTWSMDILTASVQVDGAGLAVLMIPAKSPGIERKEFWGNWVLAGAESDEVRLHDAFVPERMVVYPDEPDLARDPIHARGFAWFEMLISASYLGMASALVQRVVTGRRATPADRTGLGVEVESAMAALERLALAFDTGDREAVELARALFVRYGVQQAVERVAMRAAALVGGMAFIGSSEISYLLAACRALAYHPPSLGSTAEPLADYLAGAELGLAPRDAGEGVR